jgi:hypothetical protein
MAAFTASAATDYQCFIMHICSSLFYSGVVIAIIFRQPEFKSA